MFDKQKIKKIMADAFGVADMPAIPEITKQISGKQFSDHLDILADYFTNQLEIAYVEGQISGTKQAKEIALAAIRGE